MIGQDLRRTTLLLWVIWATASFSYYGVVLMSAELFESPGQLCSAATGALSQVPLIDIIYSIFSTQELNIFLPADVLGPVPPAADLGL